MEKIMTITLAFFVGGVITACGQQKNVPQTVKKAFNERFDKAKNVEWEKENEDEWEAEFEMDGKEYSANFSSNGTWLETEYEINKSKIPSNILSILKENFSDYEIEDAEIVEISTGKSYEFEIEQGEDEFEIVIDSNGQITQEKKIEDKEGDED